MNRELVWMNLIQFRYRVFVIPLAFFLVKTLLVDYYLRGHVMIRLVTSFEQALFLLQFLQYLVIPALLFLASYYVGRNISLRDELLTVINSLFLGSLVGSLFYFGVLLASSRPETNLYVYAVNFSRFIYEGLEIFFTSFTAIALSYLRRLNGVELSSEN